VILKLRLLGSPGLLQAEAPWGKRAENVVGIQKETTYFVSEICTSFSVTFEKGCTAWSWDGTIWNPELAPVWMCNNYDVLWTTQVTHTHTHTRARARESQIV